MPATRRKGKGKQPVRGLYIHQPPAIVAKASMASRSGHVRTLVNTYSGLGTPMDMDEGTTGVPLFEDPADYSSPTAPSPLDDSAPCVSGIRVKDHSRRYLNSDHPILAWRQFRDKYLDAFLRLDGRGLYHGLGCASCEAPGPTFRCRDCFGGRMFCQQCILDLHTDEPLHFLESWGGTHFIRVTLSALGQRYQLGHPKGRRCAFAKPAHKDFIVLHYNGLHRVRVDFCGCNPSYPKYQQLLDVAWFPSTPLEPQTCATYALLRHFHALNLRGKVSGYDFYHSLVHLTDAFGIQGIPDRLDPFMTIIREWHHIKMAKRAGRGQDSSGISGTSSGGLAVLCRACPQPSINLPQGWESASPETSWLYRLILSQDANFRLKGRLRSSEEHDPSLGPGFAYFVRSDEYVAHVEKYADQAEISHCVGFAALWLANNKKVKGLRATGVGSVSCARHEMFRPTGTGDLQKGERYCNMDYIFLSSIAGFFILSLIVSYDIACQWYKNFWTRLQSMPLRLQFRQPPAIEYKVPKFHLPPHVPECHAPFSFNYTPHVGRTDGEGVERNWSWLNGAAGSTSQMGPGGRHDTLDDFMGFSNFKKTVGLGDSLLRRLVLAIPQAMLHRQAFNAFTEGLRQEHAEEVVEWERMVEAWEADHSKPNPYALPDETITVNDIRKDLAEEEHRNAEQGTSTSADTSPSGFVISGLAIEDAQLLLQTEAKKSNQTAAQMASIQERRTHLLRRIQRFQCVQATYMPGLRAYVAEHAPSPPNLSKPEAVPIHMPSSIPTTSRSSVCPSTLVDMEERLRHAHAHEALEDLRRQLRTRTLAARFKYENVRSQGPHTRMRGLQDQIEVKVRAAQSRYNVARTALLNLRGSGDWENVLRPLAPEDIHGMNERSLTQEEHEADSAARELTGLGPDDVGRLPGIVMSGVVERGEGRRNLSWIWYNVTAAEVENDVAGSMHQCIRVEWAKARARAQRWTEEVILLDEEMRRVLEFGKWKAAWWEEQANRRECEEDALHEGVQAYAYEQADAERRLFRHWEGRWAPVRARAQAALGSLAPSFRQSEDQLADRFEELEVEVDLVPESNPEDEELDDD